LRSALRICLNSLCAWLVVLFFLGFGQKLAWAQSAGEPAVPGDVVAEQEAVLPAAPPEFQVLRREWITLEFPDSVRARVEPLARVADDFRARLSEDLGHPVLLGGLLVRIARTPSQMIVLAPAGFAPPPYAAAVAYQGKRLAILSLLSPGTWEATDLGELLRHELTHLALYDATNKHPVARWFNEGLAIRESGELPWQRRMSLINASAARQLMPFAELERSFPEDPAGVALAYAESADFVQFLMRESDRARFGSLVERVRGGVPFDRALGDAYGVDLRKLEYEWREDVAHRYGLLPLLTGGGVLWTLVVALTVVAWAIRRRRAKAKLAQWAIEEEPQAITTVAPTPIHAAAPTLDENAGSAQASRSSPVSHGVRVVEHEGRYYTVH
jgi:hypothetical protein